MKAELLANEAIITFVSAQAAYSFPLQTSLQHFGDPAALIPMQAILPLQHNGEALSGQRVSLHTK
jgi:hypothetical protein